MTHRAPPQTPPWRFRYRVAIVCVLVSACGPQENSWAGVDNAPSWLLADAPEFTYAGSSVTPLFRVNAARRWTDSLVVIADNADHQIVVIDRTGQEVARWGGNGEGPGEFRHVTDLIVHDDTLVAYDAALDRLSIYALRTGFLRTVRLDGLEYMRLLGIWNRQMVAEIRRPFGLLPTGSVHRDTIQIVTLRDGMQGDTLISFAGTEWTSHQGIGMAGVVPFGTGAPSAVRAGLIVVAPADMSHYTVIDETSRATTIPAPFPRRPVTSSDRSDFEAWLIGDDDRLAGVFRQFLDAAPTRDLTPTLDSVYVDTAARIWVRRFEAQPEQPRRWAVLSTVGTVLATLVTPRGFRPTDIGTDTMLGIRVDEDGVESVVEYAIRRTTD